jgi:hypothetical protein
MIALSGQMGELRMTLQITRKIAGLWARFVAQVKSLRAS